MTLEEIWEQQRKNHFGYCNIDKYHAAGYKGKGINFLNLEAYPGTDNHGAKVCKVYSEAAPEARVFSGVLTGATTGKEINSYGLTVGGKLYDFETFIVENNIKVMNSSKTGGSEVVSQFIKKYILEKHGVIFTAAAGNSYGEVTCPYKNSALVVGAVKYENGKPVHEGYSGKGPELHFSTFANLYNGTSFAAPFLLAQITLLLNKYGDFNQEECIEILKTLCAGNCKDDKYGWGVPVLPLADKLEILGILRKGADEMPFKDVEETRWSKNFIKMCVEEGLLTGYEDGTFKPASPITREEVAVILVRLLDKIEGRI